MIFQVTLEFDVVGLDTPSDALAYAQALASEETLTSGELVTVIEGRLTVNEL